MRTDTPHFGVRTITPPDATYVIALSFCVLSRKRSICTRIAILEKRLKLSILPIESVFIIEFHVGLKVKIAHQGPRATMQHNILTHFIIF